MRFEHSHLTVDETLARLEALGTKGYRVLWSADGECIDFSFQRLSRRGSLVGIEGRSSPLQNGAVVTARLKPAIAPLVIVGICSVITVLVTEWQAFLVFAVIYLIGFVAESSLAVYAFRKSQKNE